MGVFATSCDEPLKPEDISEEIKKEIKDEIKDEVEKIIENLDTIKTVKITFYSGENGAFPEGTDSVFEIIKADEDLEALKMTEPIANEGWFFTGWKIKDVPQSADADVNYEADYEKIEPLNVVPSLTTYDFAIEDFVPLTDDELADWIKENVKFTATYNNNEVKETNDFEIEIKRFSHAQGLFYSLKIEEQTFDFVIENPDVELYERLAGTWVVEMEMYNQKIIQVLRVNENGTGISQQNETEEETADDIVSRINNLETNRLAYLKITNDTVFMFYAYGEFEGERISHFASEEDNITSENHDGILGKWTNAHAGQNNDYQEYIGTQKKGTVILTTDERSDVEKWMKYFMRENIIYHESEEKQPYSFENGNLVLKIKGMSITFTKM